MSESPEPTTTPADDLTAALRTHTDYGVEKFEEADAVADPVTQFRAWLAEAAEREVYEPNAMVVGTIDPDGAPSVRTVLLRGVDERGFEFYTDYTSRKGRALLANPGISAVFPWYSLHRQVMLYGEARPVEQQASDDYFANRPRGAQVAAWASDQSQPIDGREGLERKVREAEERFEGVETVPRPERWGGFRIVPHRVEFWQGRTSRLHDRLVYTRDAGGEWALGRLQP